MLITEVVHNGNIVGYRIIQGDTTLDIMKNKICKNMLNYLNENKKDTISSKDSKVSTSNYIIGHRNTAELQRLYNNFNLSVNTGTLYVKEGALTVHSKTKDGYYLVDIITNNLDFKEYLHSLGLLDREDITNRLDLIYSKVSEDSLQLLINRIPLIYCTNTMINIYTEKAIERGKLNYKGFIYNVEDLNEILYRKDLTIIRLEG